MRGLTEQHRLAWMGTTLAVCDNDFNNITGCINNRIIGSETGL